MQKSRFKAFTRILINFNISSFFAFVSALKAFFAFSADITYRDDEESHTYVLKNN